MSLITINGYDITSKITKYEVTDDEPVVISTITMADGSTTVRLAPYTKTEIFVTLSNLTQTEYAIISENTSQAEADVNYYSEKTNSMKSGKFFIEADPYSIKKKTQNRNVLHELSMTLTKTR